MYILSNLKNPYQWKLIDKNSKFKSLVVETPKLFGIDILADNGDCGFTNDDLNVKKSLTEGIMSSNYSVKYENAIMISNINYSVKYENRHGYPFIKANDKKSTSKIILCSFALERNNKDTGEYHKIISSNSNGIKVISHKYTSNAIILILRADVRKNKPKPTFSFDVENGVIEQVRIPDPGDKPYYLINVTRYTVTVDGNKVYYSEDRGENFTKDISNVKVNERTDPFKNYRPLIPFNTIILDKSKNKLKLNKFKLNENKLNIIDLSNGDGDKLIDDTIKNKGVTAVTVVLNGNSATIKNKFKSALSKDNEIDAEITNVINILKKFRRWNILTETGDIINQFSLSSQE